MKVFFVLAATAFSLLSCDDTRVFEENIDFEDRHWLVSEMPEFEFEIHDTTATYNLHCNLRNAVSYPYTRIFFKYALKDSADRVLDSALVTQFLFDEKTGRPYGESGIGDLYDHRFPILMNYTFPHGGKFRVRFKQYMRMDTLPGILAVGLRVEKFQADSD